MQNIYKTMVFETILQEGIEKKSSFKICHVLCFKFDLQNDNIFVKTVCGIRKNNKISSELFQIKFSYLRFIKILTII